MPFRIDPRFVLNPWAAKHLTLIRGAEENPWGDLVKPSPPPIPPVRGELLNTPCPDGEHMPLYGGGIYVLTGPPGVGKTSHIYKNLKASRVFLFASEYTYDSAQAYQYAYPMEGRTLWYCKQPTYDTLWQFFENAPPEWDVIVIDTLNGFCYDLERLNNVALHICQKTRLKGWATLIIAHENTKTDLDPIHRIMGSMALRQNADATIHLYHSIDPQEDPAIRLSKYRFDVLLKVKAKAEKEGVELTTAQFDAVDDRKESTLADDPRESTPVGAPKEPTPVDDHRESTLVDDQGESTLEEPPTWKPDGEPTHKENQPQTHARTVLQYILEHGSITRQKAAELCGLKTRQAEYLLRKLERAGKIRRISGKTKGAEYGAE